MSSFNENYRKQLIKSRSAKLQSALDAHKKELNKVKKENALLKQATKQNIFKLDELEQYALCSDANHSSFDEFHRFYLKIDHFCKSRKWSWLEVLFK